MNYLEKLKALLTPDQYEKVVKDLTVDGKVKKLFINDGSNYIDKPSFDAKNEEVKNLTAQVTTLKNTLTDTTNKFEALEKDSKSLEEYKGKAAELAKANADIVKKSEDDLKAANESNAKALQDIKLNSDINIELFKSGAISEASQKAVRANLDMTKITSNADGSTTGLQEQLKPIKENTPGLFFGGENQQQQNQQQAVGTGYTKGTQQQQEGVTATEKIEANLYASEGQG